MFNKFYLVIAALVVSTGYAADQSQLPDEPKLHMAFLSNKHDTISVGGKYEIYKGNWMCGESSVWLEKQLAKIPYLTLAGAWKKVDTSPDVYMILKRKPGHFVTDAQAIEKLACYGAINKDCEKSTINVHSIEVCEDTGDKIFLSHN